MPVQLENADKGLQNNGGYVYDVSRDRLCFRDLESTRHEVLEYSPRIVFRRDSPDLVHVLRSIAAKRVLRGVCVVEIFVVLAQTSFGGISIDLLYGGSTYFLKYLVILRVVPRQIPQEPYKDG